MNSPQHLAIIMDGNGRWAKSRGLPRVKGHHQGVNAVRKVVKYCGDIGVERLTLFALSSENKGRPKEEVKWLLKLFLATLKLEVNKLNKANVSLEVIGDMSMFGKQLQAAVASAEKLLSSNTGLKLVIAANYGGKWDITQAVRKIAELNKSGGVRTSAIDESLIAQHLCLSGSPVDLLIRTSGEQRISNFLLWQLAYSELYFTDTFWPDFDERCLEEALQSFEGRARRFGR